MQAGFALVEAGLTRAKNVGNIMMKNLMDCMVGVLAFAVVGYSIGFGERGARRVVQLDAASASRASNDAESARRATSTSRPPTFFFFQAAFAATAATIVSGAMAERTKFKSYFVYSLVITVADLPGDPRLDVGRRLARPARVPLLGLRRVDDRARHRRLVRADGARRARAPHRQVRRRRQAAGDPGHNIAFVVLGALILFIGWFGFNPGSELAADMFVPQLAVRTLVAGCAGAIVAMIVNWIQRRKARRVDGRQRPARRPRRPSPLRSAPCRSARTPSSSAPSAASSSCSPSACFDRIKIDDPVGAISVHGVCGTWGTLSVALFAQYDDAFLGREDAGLFYGGGTGPDRGPR